MKRCYIDIESTGLHESCALIQLSGIIEIDDKAVETFDFKVRPFDDDQCEEKALEINEIDEDGLAELFNYPEPHVVYSELTSILKKYVNPYKKNKLSNDKFFLVGYNILLFDWPFFRHWAVDKMDEKYFGSWFWYPPIDVLAIAAEISQKKRHKFKSFKLCDVADYFGIKVDESRLHDSMYDIELTREIYKIISFWKLLKKNK